MMKCKKHQRIQFLFKPRHVQVEAWIINNIIFTCPSKNHLSLDSRASLSQPGENDANTGDQARDDQAHFQDLVQSSFCLMFLMISTKARLILVLDMCMRFIKAYWTYLKVQIEEEAKRTGLEKFQAIWRKVAQN